MLQRQHYHCIPLCTPGKKKSIMGRPLENNTDWLLDWLWIYFNNPPLFRQIERQSSRTNTQNHLHSWFLWEVQFPFAQIFARIVLEIIMRTGFLSELRVARRRKSESKYNIIIYTWYNTYLPVIMIPFRFCPVPHTPPGDTASSSYNHHRHRSLNARQKNLMRKYTQYKSKKERKIETIIRTAFGRVSITNKITL